MTAAHERTPRLWIAIGFITVSCIVLSFEGIGSFQLSLGSFFVIAATCCWGLENNCTRKISEKSTYEIVVLKGLFSGMGSCIVALIIGEKLPGVVFLILAALTFITNSFWGIEVIALPIVIPLAVVAYLVAGFVL